MLLERIADWFRVQLAKARMTAKQLDGMDRDIRNHNLQMLDSITDARQAV